MFEDANEVHAVQVQPVREAESQRDTFTKEVIAEVHEPPQVTVPDCISSIFW